MTALALASIVLLIGTILALALPNNSYRAAASVLSQAVATALVLAAVIPSLTNGASIRDVASWSYPIETITVHLDPLGAFFLSWSLPMTLLGTIYSIGYLRPSFATRNAGVQFALLNLTALSFVMIYTLENAVVFLLGWEIAAVAAWLLVIWEHRNQKIRFAGFNYLVSTHVGFFFLVAAFMMMHSQTGSMDFDSFATFLKAPSQLRNVTFVLLVTSFGLKSAFFPFHTWLPRAHSAAPAHVSALMSGVIHKAGLFGLLRFTLMMGEPEAWMGWYLISFSALSALMGVLYTTSQRDLKRLLGYSSTENVGIAGIGFGVGYLGLCWHQPVLVALGFTGGLLHILNHALFKCLLFYAAGAVYRATHVVDLERLGGLARSMPWTAGFFLLGGVAISALPPLNGFVSEFLIYSGLLHHAVPGGVEQGLLICAAALLAFVGGVSVLAMVRSFGLTFLGKPRDPHVHADGDAPLSMRASMWVHALGIVVFGLFPAIPLRLARMPARLFLDLQPATSVDAINDASSVLAPIFSVSWVFLAVLGGLLIVRWLLRPRVPAKRQVTWGCGYPAPNPRMQYTGTSFSSQLAGIFQSILVRLRREKLPETPFPEGDAHLNTHTVDAVERRIFEVLGEGEELVSRVILRLSEEPRLAFGLGLLILAVMVGVVVSGGGQ